MQYFICLTAHNQGQWNFEIKIFTLFFSFWDDQLFSPCHKEGSCHCPSANVFFRKEKLLWNVPKFDKCKRSVSTMDIQNSNTHYFISLCIFSFRSSIIVYKRSETFLPNIIHNLEMLTWEPLKWVFEKS